MAPQPIAGIVNLIPDQDQALAGLSLEEARGLLLAEDPAVALRIHGSFALVARRGCLVRLARTLLRPLRYLLAKQAAGPLLGGADRSDAIHRSPGAPGLAGHVHPSFTPTGPPPHVPAVP